MALRPPSERPLVRAVAAALALAGLLTPLLAARHAAESSHVACPEHGELVEADAPPAPGVHAHAVNLSTLEGETRLPTERHGHTHCALLAQAHQRALPGASQQPPVFAARASAQVARPASAPIAPAIALIHLAPKCSPPARG